MSSNFADVTKVVTTVSKCHQEVWCAKTIAVKKAWYLALSSQYTYIGLSRSFQDSSRPWRAARSTIPPSKFCLAAVADATFVEYTTAWMCDHAYAPCMCIEANAKVNGRGQNLHPWTMNQFGYRLKYRSIPYYVDVQIFACIDSVGTALRRLRMQCMRGQTCFFADFLLTHLSLYLVFCLGYRSVLGWF